MNREILSFISILFLMLLADILIGAFITWNLSWFYESITGRVIMVFLLIVSVLAYTETADVN